MAFPKNMKELCTPALIYFVISIVGMSMIFTGISMLISPSTNVDKGGSQDDNKSFMFGGATNSIEQGGVIPVVFGKFGVGSTVISSALEAVGV